MICLQYIPRSTTALNHCGPVIEDPESKVLDVSLSGDVVVYQLVTTQSGFPLFTRPVSRLRVNGWMGWSYVFELIHKICGPRCTLGIRRVKTVRKDVLDGPKVAYP